MNDFSDGDDDVSSDDAAIGDCCTRVGQNPKNSRTLERNVGVFSVSRRPIGIGNDGDYPRFDRWTHRQKPWPDR